MIGGTTVVNDLRWAGSYGVQADFIARSHCSVEIIKTEDIMVWCCISFKLLFVVECSEIPEHYNMQAVLKKFEFFPIKCRILRTAQQFSKCLDDVAGQDKTLKTKVWFDCLLSMVFTRLRNMLDPYPGYILARTTINISFFYSQTIFFWILLVRQILRYYDAHPQKRPTPTFELNMLGKNFSDSQSLEISEQEKEQIREIFELFDTDGSGKINNSEIDAAMFALGFKRSSIVNTAKNSLSGGSLVLDTISKDGSRSISLEAFTLLMKGESVGRSPLEGIWSAFTTISQCAERRAGTEQDGWGSVTLEGLRRACSEYDVKLTEDELVSMMKDADVDGNDMVDKVEFLNIMRHAPWF